MIKKHEVDIGSDGHGILMCMSPVLKSTAAAASAMPPHALYTYLSALRTPLSCRSSISQMTGQAFDEVTLRVLASIAPSLLSVAFNQEDAAATQVCVCVCVCVVCVW
jgi:hypothetical protein